MTPKFSIIIPTYNRADGRLQRALRSVERQESWHPDGRWDYEVLVVDDGSTDETSKLVWFSKWPELFRYIRHNQRQGRVIARNTGMEAAEGEWFTWLDSDDALDPMYLKTVAYHIEQEPEARLFVCSAVVHGQHGEPNNRVALKWTKIRQAWMPPVDANGQHTFFNSGKVGTGMFVFHRECYEKLGPLPPWQHPDHIADGIDEWLGLPFGTLGYGSGSREREVDVPPLLRKRGTGHIGNPYGEDHCYFQALALNYQVHLIHAALYTHYVR